MMTAAGSSRTRPPFQFRAVRCPAAVIKVVPAVGTPAPEGSIVHIYVEEGEGPYQ